MTLDPRKLKVRFLSNQEIWKRAEDFRTEHIPTDDLPIDIELVIESELGLHIIPTPGIERECGMFALLQTDLKAIRVEESNFMDDRYENKYRYDLAHEVGHWWLHRRIYEKVELSVPREWMKFIETIPGRAYSSLEYQAYEFAGRLLVPREILLRELMPMKADIRKALKSLNAVGVEDIIPYLVGDLGTKFGVSNEVISRRIRNEKVVDDLLA